MVDDNAINLETGETIYVGMFEKLPPNHYWLIDMEEKNWLELVRRLTKRADILEKQSAPPN